MRGDSRKNIGRAAHALAAERAVVPRYSATGEALMGSTWRELSAWASIDLGVGRMTVLNMARAGVLVAQGTMRVEGSRRPMLLYAPAGLGFARG